MRSHRLLLSVLSFVVLVFCATFAHGVVVNSVILRVYNTTNPPLQSPYGIAVDAAGALYVCDAGNSRVVKLSPDNTQLAVFTTPNTSQFPPLDLPTGVALDASNNVYVTDGGRGRVIRFEQSSTLLQAITPTQPALEFVSSVTVDSTGNLYLVDVDFYNHALVKTDSTGRVLLDYNTSLAGLMYPSDSALDSEGYLHVSDIVCNCVVRLDQSGAVASKLYSSGNYSLLAPVGLTVDAFDNLYVADSGNKRVLKFDHSGQLLVVFNLSSARALWSPNSVAVDSQGLLYVSDTNNRVLVFSALNPATPSTNTACSQMSAWGITHILSIAGVVLFAGSLY